MKTIRIASQTPPGDAAGAVVGQIREHKTVQVQAIGAAAVNQAVKTLALAELYMLEDGKCITTRVRRIDVDINGQPRTAMQWLAWASPAPEKAL